MPAHSTVTQAERYYEEGFWRPQTVWADIQAVLAANAEKVAFETEERSLTFGQIDRAAAALADRLLALGVGSGDVVAVLGRNSLESPVALVAAFRVGAVLAPVPPMFSAAQLQALISQCDAKALIAFGSEREIEKCASIPEETHRFLGLEPGLLDELLASDDAAEPQPVDPDAPNLLLHSSGTTSTPKGIIHTGNTLRYAVDQILERWELSGEDTFLIVNEFGFVGSIIFGYFPALLSGARCVLIGRWDPVKACEAMEAKGVTYVIMMPTHTSDLLNDAEPRKYDLSKVRAFSAPGLTPERRATFLAEVGQTPLADYGLSEVPGNCAHGLHEDEAKVLKTEGLPYRGTEVRIVDSDGEALGPGEQGQVEVNGPSRFIGFLGNEELTQQLLAPWGGYKTGDLGYLDEDGHLVYLGRSKDTIERAGVQIVPSDVEPTVLEHPAIREVALVPLPHERLGETVCAAMILVEGASAPSLEDLQEFLTAKDVAKYTWPESIEVFAEFPDLVAEAGQGRNRRADHRPAAGGLRAGGMSAAAEPEPTPGPGHRDDGAKRAAILYAATERFGRDGYEGTKWADVAGDVGVGPTALYHYFESKQHCLFVIMAEAAAGFRADFDARRTADPGPRVAIRKTLEGTFDLDDHAVMTNRLIVAEQGLMSTPRRSPREEQARRLAHAKARDVEIAWSTFLSRAMESGAIPEADPRLLTRSLLGLYNSVWHWYRPGGVVTLDQLRDFFVIRSLFLLGIDNLEDQTDGQP